MRVIFMGTPAFSVTALDALVDAGHKIVCVYSQPPRPAGRGKKNRPSPVHARAMELGLEVRHPVSLKTADVQQEFAVLNADIAVVVAYGLILPQAVLDAPLKGCLNIHASLLPRWRGAAPIHRAIMAGDSETGVGIMQMEAGLDTGPVHLEKRIPIEQSDTTGTLHDKLSLLGADAIVEVLKNIEASSPTPQSIEGVTYAKKIDKSEAHIDWQKSARDLRNHIHGLSPFPGAWCEMNGERIKIHNVGISENNGNPGVIIDTPLTIACGDGSIEVKRAQRAGKGPMDIAALMNGFDVKIGTKFS